MYKAIIFDLGRVLVNFDFQRAYAAMEGLCPHPSAEIPARLSADHLVERFESGLIEPRDFVAEISKRLDLNVDYDHFCRIWSCIFTEVLVPEEMLIGLAQRYNLLLLSNTNALHFAMLRQTYPQLRHFHHLILSHEVHAIKPRPEIFQAALDRAGCKPEECFYTDDILIFIEAAKKFGIDAVQFHSVAQLEDDFRLRGIRWDML